MKGLEMPDSRFVGAHYGVNSADVAEALTRFEAKLQERGCENEGTN
jgi:hypothetical protein